MLKGRNPIPKAKLKPVPASIHPELWGVFQGRASPLSFVPGNASEVLKEWTVTGKKKVMLSQCTLPKHFPVFRASDPEERQGAGVVLLWLWVSRA